MKKKYLPIAHADFDRVREHIRESEALGLDPTRAAYAALSLVGVCPDPFTEVEFVVLPIEPGLYRPLMDEKPYVEHGRNFAREVPNFGATDQPTRTTMTNTEPDEAGPTPSKSG